MSFQSPIDPMAVRARHLDDSHTDDAVYLVRLSAAAGQGARSGLEPTLWGRDAEAIATMAPTGRNVRYLADVPLPPSLKSR